MTSADPIFRFRGVDSGTGAVTQTEAPRCDWAAGSCGLPATTLLLEGAPADVLALYLRDESWRPMCARHTDLACSGARAASSDFAVITRPVPDGHTA